MTDIAKIAAGLSEGDTVTLMRLTDEPQTARKGKFSPASAMTIAYEGLAKIGEDETGWFDTYRISPLGLAVRNHLISQRAARKGGA